MKRYITKFIIFLILIMTFSNVSASTKVYERTEDNLRIHESISVNGKNLDKILKTPSIDEKEKVYDFADLFIDSEEVEIYNKIKNYIDLTNYDLAVVSINENNKADEVKYADDFYDYNYFGFDDSFSGTLILIDMDNREIYLSTTGYAIKMYSDTRIDRIIDNGYDYLVDGKYAKCILSMIDKMSDYYHSGVPSGNKNLVIDGRNVYYSDKRTISENLLTSGVVAAGITAIIAFIMYKKTRLKIKKANTISYLTSEKDIDIRNRFIRSSISRVLRSTNSGGSSGGGSSYHSSSSGSSHGGGGRSF